MIYFSFTTLSTVGLGDYHPKNDFERALMSIVLLMGVACFSYIMSIFVEMVNILKTFNSDFSDGDDLSKFFALIRRFNHDEAIDQDMKQEIEEYFEFKWNNDKNLAVST